RHRRGRGPHHPRPPDTVRGVRRSRPPRRVRRGAARVSATPQAADRNFPAAAGIILLDKLCFPETPVMSRPFRWTAAVAFVGLGLVLGTFLTGSRSAGENGPPLPRELSSYRDVVKRVLPAVVSIDAKAKPRKSTPRARPDNFDRYPPEFQRQWEEQER